MVQLAVTWDTLTSMWCHCNKLFPVKLTDLLIDTIHFIIPLGNEIGVGYIGFTLSVCLPASVSICRWHGFWSITSDFSLCWNLSFNFPIDGLVQERCNSIASAMELHLSCTNPSIWIFPIPVLLIWGEDIIIDCWSKISGLLCGCNFLEYPFTPTHPDPQQELVTALYRSQLYILATVGFYVLYQDPVQTGFCLESKAILSLIMEFGIFLPLNTFKPQSHLY